MYKIEYYTRGNGRQPVVDWRDKLGKKDRTVIDDKIRKLRTHGLKLIGTDMLKAIAGDERDLYELRGGQCRIGMYYDIERSIFVLLHGWLKKKQVQSRDIEQTRRLFNELRSKKRS